MKPGKTAYRLDYHGEGDGFRLKGHPVDEEWSPVVYMGVRADGSGYVYPSTTRAGPGR